MNARRQYLDELGKEYSRADEKNRGRLLDEAEKRTGLNRLVSDPGFEPPAGAEAAEAAKATGGIRSGGGDGVGRGMGCIRTAVRTAAGGGAGKRAGAAEETRGVALHGYGGRTTGGDFSEEHRSSAGTREASATFLRPNRNPNVQRLIYQKVPVKVAAEWAVSKKVPAAIPTYLGPTGRERPEGHPPQRGLQHGARSESRKRVSTLPRIPRFEPAGSTAALPILPPTSPERSPTSPCGPSPAASRRCLEGTAAGWRAASCDRWGARCSWAFPSAAHPRPERAPPSSCRSPRPKGSPSPRGLPAS